MQPLSERTRRLYLVLFIALFFAMLPIVIFYADGWRYKDGYGFVRTGGIFVSVPYPDASVYMNGVQVGRSGFLARSFYISDLAPSAYIIHVEREGYMPWDRLLVVEEQLVTDTRALLIPDEFEVLRIIATSSPLAVSTTTRYVDLDAFEDYVAIFAATTTASSTLPIDEINGFGLFLDRGRLSAQWIQENSFPPSQFCERPTSCVEEIVIERSGVTRARFFRGGVVYALNDGKVMFTELDIRQTPISMQLYSARGADIRIIDDELIIKVGNNLFEVTL